MAQENSFYSYSGDGTASASGNNWYINCTGAGTFTPKVDMYIDVFIVGGGGGGNYGHHGWWGRGGGGGAGGYRVTKRGIFLKANTTYSITIGAGGTSGKGGGSSSAFGYTANGGNAGAHGYDSGHGGTGGSNGGNGSYIDGNVSYTSSTKGADGDYAFGESTWDSIKYGAGGGGGCSTTDSSNNFGDWISGYYNGRSSGMRAPGGATGAGAGGDITGAGGNATSYGSGGGGGGSNGKGGSGYQGIVIIRNSRTGTGIYNLVLNKNTGANCTVRRTASSQSNVNVDLLNGAFIYNDDSITITFSPQENHRIIVSTLNGATITSGKIATVSGAVTIVITAQPLSSLISATDANIGSTTVLNITRYDNSYTHTVEYSFSDLSGTIKTKTTELTFSWTVPTDFYIKIPNSKTGVCTITCKTFSGEEQIGSSTCNFTVTASEELSKPVIEVAATDVNATTVALTGNNQVFIRYRSTARCTISATARNSSTISSKAINGVAVSGSQIELAQIDTGSFTFSATDSRAYTTTQVLSKTLINYIPLTISASIVRDDPTSSNLRMALVGNFYQGNFGAESNTLRIRYRYHDSSSSQYPSTWIYIDMSKVSINNSTYATPVSILLTPYENDDFSYRKNFQFQIQALDGTEENVLTTETTTLLVQKGIPVFDWGENDFQFNVPVDLPGLTINGVDLATYIRNIVSS